MEELYLVMTNAGANNNKYYHMVPHGDVFDVYYGRIGASEQHASYPISKWNTKYNEKIRKGYTDQTANHRTQVVTKKSEPEYKSIENAEIAELVRMLQEYADRTIRRHYRVSAMEATPQMVQAAQTKINLLYLCRDVWAFNSVLNELFMILPRRMAQVADYMAKNSGKRHRQLLSVQAAKKSFPVLVMITTGAILLCIRPKIFSTRLVFRELTIMMVR